MKRTSHKQWIEKIVKRDRRAIGRLITKLENHDSEIFPILKKLFPKTGKAVRVGITGFPGAGKSTIINQLVKQLVLKRKKVGVVLMDPSSPFTGGALLGDRVRMKEAQVDSKVFIRSMATRGRLGGLNLAARYASDILDAAGFDYIIIETVGVGQLEIDVTTSTDITLVVMTPESGDEIQAMKAGLMEVADVFVINKMDRDKEKIYFSRIKKGLEWYSEARQTDLVDVVPLEALYGKGVDLLTQRLLDVKKKKSKAKKQLAKEKLKAEMDIRACLEEYFRDELLSQPKVEEKIKQLIPKVRNRSCSPYSAAEQILRIGMKKRKN